MMKTIRMFYTLLLAGCAVCSCKKETSKEAIFHRFEYQGQDLWFMKDIDPDKEFFNPTDDTDLFIGE